MKLSSLIGSRRDLVTNNAIVQFLKGPPVIWRVLERQKGPVTFQRVYESIGCLFLCLQGVAKSRSIIICSHPQARSKCAVLKVAQISELWLVWWLGWSCVALPPCQTFPLDLVADMCCFSKVRMWVLNHSYLPWMTLLCSACFFPSGYSKQVNVLVSWGAWCSLQNPHWAIEGQMYD